MMIRSLDAGASRAFVKRLCCIAVLSRACGACRFRRPNMAADRRIRQVPRVVGGAISGFNRGLRLLRINSSGRQVFWRLEPSDSGDLAK